MRSTKEAKTTEVSIDNQPQHQREKNNSLQPEEKFEATTTNETRICSHEATVEDTTRK